ncbi:hypothetical protein B0H13DRAFT_1865070 [Mycena leptocephala]|nr:hypothetical protein B0H13DRAFT_1865070 [Mycena leptocephala]
MFWYSAAATLRVEIPSNSNVAYLVGRLFQSPLGANLISIHMSVSGNEGDIIIFLASVPNVHEILTLLLPARGLVRFDYICNTSLSPGFESPDAQLLDSLRRSL